MNRGGVKTRTASALGALFALALFLLLGQTLAAAHGVLHPDHVAGHHHHPSGPEGADSLCAAADLLTGAMPLCAPPVLPAFAAAEPPPAPRVHSLPARFPGWFHSRAPPLS